jgi:hypothetical protein
VLGFLELSLSNPTAAMGRPEPVLAFLHELGSPEPGIIPCLPDAIEALVSPWAGWRRPKRSSSVWSAKDEPSTDHGPSPPPPRT